MNRMMGNDKKKVFISYSHADYDFSKRVAEALINHGIEVFWDKWDLMPGDSLIEKIFCEGLASCDVFIIILSNNSVKSKWVKEELDSATVRRIKGITKIIPIRKENCEIPDVLKTIVWIDLSDNFDNGIDIIVKSIYHIPSKPPIGSLPDYVKELNINIGGLSKVASAIGTLLISHDEDNLSAEKSFSSEDIKTSLNSLSIQEINDGVDELAEYGLVKTKVYSGCAPFDFSFMRPTYNLFLHYRNNGLGYDPVEDIKIVAANIASKGESNGNTLQQFTGLTPTRINRAVSYLEDRGIIRVRKFGGTDPFNFGILYATRKTRQLFNNNS